MINNKKIELKKDIKELAEKGYSQKEAIENKINNQQEPNLISDGEFKAEGKNRFVSDLRSVKCNPAIVDNMHPSYEDDAKQEGKNSENSVACDVHENTPLAFDEINNKILIEEMREEFVKRCIVAYDEGSMAFFDNLDESYYWIDTLITAVKQETSKAKDKEWAEYYGGFDDGKEIILIKKLKEKLKAKDREEIEFLDNLVKRKTMSQGTLEIIFERIKFLENQK